MIVDGLITVSIVLEALFLYSQVIKVAIRELDISFVIIISLIFSEKIRMFLSNLNTETLEILHEIKKPLRFREL